MKIGQFQYTEIANQLRAAKQDDNQRIKEDSQSARSASTPRATGDVAELSEGARKMSEVYQMTNKLKEVPDPREEKVERVLDKLRNGALLNPENVKRSISMMVASGIIS